ncbi:hypothetical protein CAMRE0001_2548 [Campylobacter rectus RM3267]|uniref:Uncharacterized protein n=1 Tax=Campylobacter rectus RM3267 TaxID=553218 RepID=B9D3T4_CAMRE|nr:hypothetical protein CAMRE0001_2548 [Campylobacter rectus RM3267]
MLYAVSRGKRLAHLRDTSDAVAALFDSLKRLVITPPASYAK